MPCERALRDWWQRHPRAPHERVAVAFSGGADSTALLLAAHALWPQQVWALHVHHGLQAAADGFEHHARSLCQALGVGFVSRRVQAAHQSGESPEEAAREARYRALAEMAQQHGCAVVWLAHQADDQAETVLLALSRGAGLPGLAGMAERFERHGTVFERPMLSVDARALRADLDARGVSYVDDPSNRNTALTRNRIRHHLLPVWQAQFPAYAQTLARSARHAAQAQRLLAEWAALDLSQVGDPPHIGRLRALSSDRQANLLRFWLVRQAQRAPSEAQLEALLRQVAACTTRGHQIDLKVAQGHVRRRGDVLVYEAFLGTG